MLGLVRPACRCLAFVSPCAFLSCPLEGGSDQRARFCAIMYGIYKTPGGNCLLDYARGVLSGRAGEREVQEQLSNFALEQAALPEDLGVGTVEALEIQVENARKVYDQGTKLMSKTKQYQFLKAELTRNMEALREKSERPAKRLHGQ